MNYFFFSSRRRHTRWPRDWSSDVCSSDLIQQTYHKDNANNLSAIKVRVQHGDTVLSIIEQINHQLPEQDIEQMIIDFRSINPNIDPYNLQGNTIYYFPVY